MGNIILGAFLTFKSAPLYSAYDVLGRMFGMDPITDEQLGGLTMWLPGCMMFALSAILILHRFGADEERVAERRRRTGTAEAHAAVQAENLPRANRALAVGLGTFALLVLVAALTSAVLYDHATATSARPLTRISAGISSTAHDRHESG